MFFGSGGSETFLTEGGVQGEAGMEKGDGSRAGVGNGGWCAGAKLGHEEEVSERLPGLAVCLRVT